MKKTTILFFIFLSVIGFSQTEYKPDIRNVKWEMSKEQVKKYEKITKIIKENKNLITTKTTVSDFPCSINYIFIKNKLHSINILFDREYSDKDFNTIVYEEIENYITHKYGKPEISGVFLGLYKYDPKTIGVLLSKQNVYYLSRWRKTFYINERFNQTTIQLKINGNKNGKINIFLNYNDGSSINKMEFLNDNDI